MAKHRRRGNGDGSVITIRRKGKPNRYAAELTLGWKDGKRRYARSASYATRPEAEAALVTLREHHGRGVDLTNRDTLGAFIVHWLDHTYAPTANKLKSVQSYRWPVTRIVAAIGDIPLKRLTRSDIQEFLNTQTTRRGDPVSKGTAQLLLVVLRQALAQARSDGLMTHDPAADVKLPTHKARATTAHVATPTRKKFLLPDEARAFLQTIRGERLELAMRMALSFGLRRGEVCGLRWTDIDIDARRLTINGTLQRITGRGLVWDSPKPGVSRSFKLPAALASALSWHKTRQQAERAATQHLWHHDHDYVFTSTRGGPLDPQAFYDAVKAAAARIRRPDLTPHGLRHSAASFLYNEGVPTKDISVYLGHSSSQVTENVYVHIFGHRIDDNAERIERLLGDASDPNQEAM
jgi:integrase